MKSDFGEYQQQPLQKLQDITVNTIYKGRVVSLKDFGAFVELESVWPRRQGLVHISQIVSGRRLDAPNEVLEKGQMVYVRVMSTDGSKLSLSIKDVD